MAPINAYSADAIQRCRGEQRNDRSMARGEENCRWRNGPLYDSFFILIAEIPVRE
jgi:hypothetical protein